MGFCFPGAAAGLSQIDCLATPERTWGRISIRPKTQNADDRISFLSLKLSLFADSCFLVNFFVSF